MSTQTRYNSWGITISFPQVSSLQLAQEVTSEPGLDHMTAPYLKSGPVLGPAAYLAPHTRTDWGASIFILCPVVSRFHRVSASASVFTEPSSGTKETPDHWTVQTHSLKQNLMVLNHTEVVHKDQTEPKTTNSNQFEPIHMWTLIQIVWIWLKLVSLFPCVNMIIWTFQKMFHQSEQK